MPAGSTIRSPGLSSMRFPSASRVKVIDPVTQYSTFSYPWLWAAYLSPGLFDHE